MSALDDLISDIEAMQSEFGDTWYGPFGLSKDDDFGSHIEWPNLAISLRNVKAEPRLTPAQIIDKLCPIITSLTGVYVTPKLSNELVIRLNDLLQGGETNASEVTSATGVSGS